MDTHQIPPARRAGLHPLMILAALAVVLFSMVGTAAIMGWLPSSIGSNPSNRQLSEADRIALSTSMQPGTPVAPLAAAAAAAHPAVRGATAAAKPAGAAGSRTGRGL
jgi:hypothetical protein